MSVSSTIPAIRYNDIGQPIGAPVGSWSPRVPPPRRTLTGRYCVLEPLTVAAHAADLYEGFSQEPNAALWTYLPYGPFPTLESYTDWVAAGEVSTDPLFYAIMNPQTKQAAGVASYLRIDPANGVIEVGHLAYTAPLRRSPAATEAMFLLMQQAFELGYRRYEWKCDSLNAPSRAAAERLGFRYEGCFRQAVIYKQRSRDTTWYSIMDHEWPELHAAFTQWLSPDNFDTTGQQRTRLSDLTRHLRRTPDLQPEDQR